MTETPDPRRERLREALDGLYLSEAGTGHAVRLDDVLGRLDAAGLTFPPGKDGRNPGQRERVTDLIQNLHGVEKRRLQAGRDGDKQLSSDLAEMNRRIVGEMSPPDMRSLILRLVVPTLNPAEWPRCEHCGRLTLDCGAESGVDHV